MPTFLNWTGTVLLGTVLITGCASGPNKSAKPAPAAQPKAAADTVDTIPILSPEEEDRRAEAHAYYAEAVIDEFNEDWDKAKEAYWHAGEADPANESVVLESSQRLLQLKEPDKALSILTNAAALPEASAKIYAQLGRILFMTGKKEAALQANKTAMRKDPKLISVYRNLAQIYLQERQYDEALKYLDVAARQTDVEPGYLIELGELYTAFISTGPTASVKERALDCFKRAAAMNITNLFQIQALANSFALLGQSDQAVTLFEKLLKHRPPLPGLRERIAEIYLRKKDYAKAAQQLESMLRDNPTDVRANFLMGSIAYEQHKLPEAVDYFRKTLLLNPDFEPAYYELAAAQLNQREARKALTTLEKARDKFKQTYPMEYFSALAFSQLKEYTNVIKHLTAAEVVARGSGETNRLDHFYYFQLAAAYERSQNIPEAEKYMKKCLEISPDFSEALNYLGYMWAERGTNLSQARDMIEKALKQDPTNAAFLDSLGWVFYKQGKKQEALKYILLAVENSKEPDATLYDHLGDIYSALKQPDKAREAWRKSLSVEPNDQIQKKLGATTTSQLVPP